MKRLLVTLLVAAIVAFPLCYVTFFSPTKTPPSSPTINVVLKVQQFKDGSVLFWKDGFLINPILKNTGSHLTHAALILDGYVYEAVPPCVHKVPLAKYLKEMKDKSQIPFQEKRGIHLDRGPTEGAVHGNGASGYAWLCGIAAWTTLHDARLLERP